MNLLRCCDACQVLADGIQPFAASARAWKHELLLLAMGCFELGHGSWNHGRIGAKLMNRSCYPRYGESWPLPTAEHGPTRHTQRIHLLLERFFVAGSSDAPKRPNAVRSAKEPRQAASCEQAFK